MARDPFDSRPTRAAALLEIIGIGHADNEFHPEESGFVRKMASSFGLSDGDVQAMESWVERQLALAQEAERLLNG